MIDPITLYLGVGVVLEMLRELFHGARDRHTGGVHGAHAKALHNFRQAPLHFNARHDQLALLGLSFVNAWR